MDFLFESIAFRHNRPLYYRLYKTGENCYKAELINTDVEHYFQFRKEKENWITDQQRHQHEADQLGEEIDRWLKRQ